MGARPRQKTALSLAIVLAGNLMFRSRGNPAKTSGSVRALRVLVPSAMGHAGAKYQESAFEIGCPLKIRGEPAL
jgi:hypothetical protein